MIPPTTPPAELEDSDEDVDVGRVEDEGVDDVWLQLLVWLQEVVWL